MRTWKIDRDRVFFAGHSMGGYGTWTLGAHHADRVAALAASAGAPTPILGAGGAMSDVAPGVIPNLRNVPIVVYQSDDDPNVPPAANDVAVKKLDEAQKRWGGFVHEYWQVPGRQHQEAPGGMPALLAKIKDNVRNTRPTRVVWQPALKWKRQFYWLWWSSPALEAIVVADADKAKNEVSVTCTVDPRGLEVLLDEALVDVTREVVVKLNDKEVFRGIPKADLGTLAKTWLTGDADLAFAMRVKLSP
jgi:pimeloyl-ACP methyl ester carboxylesterase